MRTSLIISEVMFMLAAQPNIYISNPQEIYISKHNNKRIDIHIAYRCKYKLERAQ